MTTTQNAAETKLEATDLVERCDGLLSEPHRRYLLYCLCLYQNSMSLSAIADQVTVWEDDESATTYEQRRNRIYSELYRDHLPVLRSVDVVEYDEEDDLVTLGAQAARLKPIVQLAYENEVDVLLEAEGKSIRDE